MPALSVPQPAATGQHRVAAAATSGQQLWVKRYRGPDSPANFAAGAVMSPDGTKVFVTGTSWGPSSEDYATVAYRTSTGTRLWVARYPGKRFLTSASSIAVSPDGTRLFVTGQHSRSGTASDYTTVAYRAATGAQVWVARYNGPANSNDTATSVAVSPRGDIVFVTGFSQGTTTGQDYATVAYRAATGTQLWARRYNVAGSGDDTAAAVAVSPSGQTIFVTGSTAPGPSSDYLTVAYRAATGKWLWGARYNGPGNGDDFASSVKVTPDSSTVLVTGTSYGGQAVDHDWATIAYHAATGTRHWVSRYNGTGSGYDSAASLALDPRGARVYVTGNSTGKTSGLDCATAAYRTGSGARVWVRRYSGPGNGSDSGRSIATSPDGSKVFITGMVTGITSDGDYLTIGYHAATGAWLWGRHYNGPANSLDRANAIVTSASRVVVTGDSFLVLGNPGTSGYATIAYAP